MRSSFLLASFAVAIVGCSVSTTDNSITFKTQPEFVDPNQPPKTTTQAWNGEQIEIKNAGVNPALGASGVTVVVDPAATTVSVKADIVARADVEAEAQLSMKDALATFQLVESPGKVAISCGNGGNHGSSKAAASGCKRLTVTIPAGTADQPHVLRVGGGNGEITFRGAPFVSDAIVDNNGLGDVDVSFQPVRGAKMVVTGETSVVTRLPADFAADSVVLTIGGANLSSAEENAARVNTSAFPGMETNKPYGTVGTGASLLNVQTKGTLSSYTVTIARL